VDNVQPNKSARLRTAKCVRRFALYAYRLLVLPIHGYLLGHENLLLRVVWRVHIMLGTLLLSVSPCIVVDRTGMTFLDSNAFSSQETRTFRSGPQCAATGR
jgi:hypothetical protein